MSWDLIIWKLENSCDLVPSSWATNSSRTVYLYPKNIKPSKIKKIIKNCNEPSIDYEYVELEATFKKTVKEFAKGEHLLTKLQFSSAVESDDDQDQGSFLNINRSTAAYKTSLKKSNEKELSCDSVLLTKFDELNNNYKLILHLLSKMSLEVKDISATQNEIKNKLCSNFNYTNLVSDWPLQFPITTNKDLEDAENLLPDKQQILAKILSLVGGNTLRHSITLMLKKLLSKDMAFEYSGKGRKGKKNFSKTKLYPVIVDAARLIKNDATDSLIGQFISFSLASAGDWDGSNTRKKSTVSKQTDPESNDVVETIQDDEDIV